MQTLSFTFSLCKHFLQHKTKNYFHLQVYNYTAYTHESKIRTRDSERERKKENERERKKLRE